MLKLREIYDTFERVKYPAVFTPPPYVSPTKANLMKSIKMNKKNQINEVNKDGVMVGEKEVEKEVEIENYTGPDLIDEVHTKTVFKAFGLDSESQLNYFLARSIKPKQENGHSLIFSEYVNLVCFLGMLGEKDFSKFLFACADIKSEFHIK